jgi:thioesterase domain-containing protein
LFRAPSIRGLARLLTSDAREFDFRQVVKLQAGGSRLPLIAINNTGVYYLMAKRLGTDQPVTSLQVFDPAAKRSDLPDTLEGIAAEYVQLIRRVHARGPYVLIGWCVAGALAFEIARQLVELQHPVAQLFLVDSWAPEYFKRLPLLRRVIGGYSLRWQLLRADWRRYVSGEQTLAEFLNERVTIQRLRSMFSHAPAVAGEATNVPLAQAAGPEEYDKWLLRYLRATTDRYKPRLYPGRITLFRSTQEPTGWLFDPLAGWGDFAAGGVELILVEGNHFTMFQDPGASQMAAHMVKLLGSKATEAPPAISRQSG